MLVAKWDDLGLVMAREGRKGLAYSCPGCGDDLVLKQGNAVVHHFAHKAGERACGYAAGETLAHMKGKQLLHDAFTRRGLRVEVECRIETPLGERIADVLVHDGKHRVALEVQHSEISVEDLLRRTQAYMSAGVRVLWVPLLSAERAGLCRRGRDQPPPRGRFYPHAWRHIRGSSKWPTWHHWISNYQNDSPYLDVEREEIFAVRVHPNSRSGSDGQRYANSSGPWSLDDLSLRYFWHSGRAARFEGTIPKGPAARVIFPDWRDNL